MATPDSSQLAADKSRLAVKLAHLGDGIMIGSVVYFSTAFIFHLSSRYFVRSVGDHPGLVGLLAVVLFVVAGRLIAVAHEDGFEETLGPWKRKRQLRWIAVISLLTTGSLLGSTLWVSWKALVTLLIPYAYSLVVGGIGFGIRLIGDHIV